MSSTKLGNLRTVTQKLLRRNADGRLKRVLEKSHNADVAAVMRFMNTRERRATFDLLPDRDAMGEVLSEVDDNIVTELALGMADDLLVDLLGRMSPDDAADVLGEVPEDRSEELLRRLNTSDEEDLQELLKYDEDTAGGIMVPDFLALEQDTMAGEAIRQLQTAADIEMVFYIYVVNEHGQLVGVVSLRQLVVCPPQTALRTLMETEVISVRAEEDREEVARVVARYNVLAVPVVDDGARLLGIITVDDVIDVIREEATEDFLKMAGIPDEELLEAPTVARAVRVRMPWLMAAFLGGVGAALIIGSYEEAMGEVAALAAFIPIIMGMGGNVGTQSSTLVVRGLATGQVDVRAFGQTILRELGVGVAMGLVYGFFLGAVTLVVYNSDPSGVVGLAVAVGLSVCASMAVAAMVGAGLPLVFHRLNIDPAVATGPFVTTAVDIAGIVIYFSIAQALIPQLASVGS